MPLSDDPYGVALGQLEEYGLVIESFAVDGVLHRVPHRDDKPRKKDGWYVASELVTEAGQRIVIGAYGWWKDPDKHTLKVQARGLSQADRARLARQRRAMQAAAKQEREARAANAAQRAVKIWAGLPEMGGSDYLKIKKVRSFGLRFTRGSVVVPLRRIDGQMTGLQFIAADGAKRFLTGTAVKGAHHLMGKPLAGEVLAIAEGYATAATVHKVMGWPVAVAFDCGNLEPVALALRKAYPGARIVVAGDDDLATAGNPGRSKASFASSAVDGRALFPRFSAGQAGVDWNDLLVAAGQAEVRTQLLAGIGDVESPPPPSEVGGGLSFAFTLASLLDDFVLIYGTETVFDGRINRIITVAGLRLAAGRDLVKLWLEHPERRVVLCDGVVFEPSGHVSPQQVNLFNGWPLHPSEGSVTRLLEMLYYLVGESDAVFHWILCWCAYPLQHPGAKMRTAIVMHGPEGTGKNLWWGAVRAIYGEYGTIITQSELESQFNAWASRKLFCIGNEVVSRQEVYHQKGRLKNMITEDEWLINEKMLPVRTEGNHANFVFLSNVIRPAAPDPDDRRYMVVWTPPKMDDEFYGAVVAEQRRAGAGALYDYLLKYDCGNFNEHSKPIETEAKRDLIEASMDSPELFWVHWSGGDLAAPFTPCRAGDLYQYYRRWCNDAGERHPGPQKIFGVAMGKRMQRINTWVSGGSGKAKARMYQPIGWEADEGVPRDSALGKCAESFYRRAGLDEG